MGPEWAPALFLSIAVLVGGGVILLRPMARRMGDLMDVLIQEKRHALEAKTDVESLSKRVELLEDRLQFTERLVTAGKSAPGEESTGK
jgi:hypothetical protein